MVSRIYQRLDNKKAKDLRVLRDFISVFCRQNHREEDRDVFRAKDDRLRQALGDRELLLGRDCGRLFEHGSVKLLLCPYDPKPMCKKCPNHCYAPGYREEIRKVMRFSGLYMIKHGRLDILIHYLF